MTRTFQSVSDSWAPNVAQAGGPPTTEHGGDVSRALKVLGIRQILAYSPQARGRSERAFETIQGRLPQELRVVGITTYEGANDYLDASFVSDFNDRFTVIPAQSANAFVPVVGVDLELLLSLQHTRTVQNDSTVLFRSRALQLPRPTERAHYVRYQVTVHEFPEGTLGISYQGRELAPLLRRRDSAAVPATAARPARLPPRCPARWRPAPLPTTARRPHRPRTSTETRRLTQRTFQKLMTRTFQSVSDSWAPNAGAQPRGAVRRVGCSGLFGPPRERRQ